jgi:triacylglycerol esterase/lipase EstA (alpha/beta hydrolase family)
MKPEASEYVILLHGLARTNVSMLAMQKAISHAGYKAINYHYPSREYTIAELAEIAISEALAQCESATKIHFVTHSMGGILVRQYLRQHKIEKLGHVVMLGPPNKGSELVDLLADLPGFKTVNGPAGMQLGTKDLSVPNSLGPVDFSLGVVAGTQTINLILSSFLPKPNDGKVSVESTKVEGMTDHIELPATHPFMMWNPDVIEQVLFFLKHGRFDNSPKT